MAQWARTRALLVDAGQEPTDKATVEILTAFEEAATEKGEPLSEGEARQFVRDR